MENNTKYVIIVDHDKAKGELSFDQLRSVLQFMEESELVTKTFHAMAEQLDTTQREDMMREAMEPLNIPVLYEKLSDVADKAEEYRDSLNDFIQEADALLEKLSDLDAYWNDREYREPEYAE